MLKPINRDQTVAVVSLADPAWDLDASAKVDHEGDEILAHARNRWSDPSEWRQSMISKSGERPTEFVIGIIPPSEVARIEDECLRDTDRRWREQCWRAFCASLVDVKGGFETDNVPRETIDGVRYIAPSWIRQTFVGTLYHVAIEIGSVAWHWNRMMGDDAKN